MLYVEATGNLEEVVAFFACTGRQSIAERIVDGQGFYIRATAFFALPFLIQGRLGLRFGIQTGQSLRRIHAANGWRETPY